MTTPREIRDKVGEVIAADAAIDAWAQATYKREVTILKGQVLIKKLTAKEFPFAIVNVTPEKKAADRQSWTVSILITLGTMDDRYNSDIAEQNILAFTELVKDLFDGDAGVRRCGPSTISKITNIQTDNGVLVPKMLRAVDLDVIYER